MTPWLQDADVTLYHGDVLQVLRDLPAESVDCCVTSPPYWGLRDYGTGAWEGGDERCDHVEQVGGMSSKSTLGAPGHEVRENNSAFSEERGGRAYRDTCGKCGATRIDQQLGLEPTPEEYVTRMVEVFREVRRVLASHGTVWLNLGDSYASAWACDRRNVIGAGSLESGKREDRPNRLVGGLKEKDLVGIPWRVAFALQADGWYLRSDIIWAKPNPMPESVTDRPTKAHEYVFLLSKQPRYFFDQEAVREAHQDKLGIERFKGKCGVGVPNENQGWHGGNKTHTHQHNNYNPAGRNIRSVWEIATQPYPEAHFATFPEELARRCIAAGCPEQVCRVCGKARERITSTEYVNPGNRRTNGPRSVENREKLTHATVNSRGSRLEARVSTEGFTDCVHADYRPGLTLDPFIGSGTVAHVARKFGRHAVGIDLNESYLELAARRLQQQSLFADVT